jgi:hypothetical protein
MEVTETLVKAVNAANAAKAKAEQEKGRLRIITQ